MFDHLRTSINEGQERIDLLKKVRKESIRQSFRKKDEAAWRRVEAKIDAAIRRWQGGENNAKG